MAGILDALEKVAATHWNRFWEAPGWRQFVATGDPKHLKGLPKPSSYEWLPTELVQGLGMPKSVDEHGKRLLQACLRAGLESAVGQWLASLTSDDEPAGDHFDEGCQVLRDLGCSIGLLANQVARRVSPLNRTWVRRHACSPRQIRSAPGDSALPHCTGLTAPP